MNHLQSFQSFNESVSNKIYYHGRSTSRPYSGSYIYITDSIEYAASYAVNESDTLYALKLNFPENEIFTIRDRKHVHKLATVIDARTIEHILSMAGNDELDWSMLSYLETDDFEEADETLQHLGFKGIHLKERPYANSILVFDDADITMVDEVDMNTPEMNTRMTAWYKYLEANWNHV